MSLDVPVLIEHGLSLPAMLGLWTPAFKRRDVASMKSILLSMTKPIVATPLKESLTRAVKTGDVAVVTLLMDGGVEVDIPRVNLFIPELIVGGHEDMTVLLVKRGVFRIELNYVWGYLSPLTLAAQEGHTKTVRALIDHAHVDLHQTSEQALVRAVEYGHYDVVRELLSRGANARAGLPVAKSSKRVMITRLLTESCCCVLPHPV